MIYFKDPKNRTPYYFAAGPYYFAADPLQFGCRHLQFGCREVNVTERIVVSLLRLGFESYDKLARMSPQTWPLYSLSR